MENQNRLINRGILFFELLFFATLFLFWGIFYSNHLIQKEQMQLFLMDWAFLKSHLAFQGGITKWLAGFLIQFFFNPWLGAFIYALAIFLLYTVVKKILKNLNRKVVFMWAFLPAIGYFMLLLNDFYYFAGIWATILALTSVLIYMRFNRRMARAIAGAVLIVANYWLGGGAYLILLTGITIVEIYQFIPSKSGSAKIPFIIQLVSGFWFLAFLLPVINHSLVYQTWLQSCISSVFYKFTATFPLPGIFVLLSIPLVIILHLVFARWNKWFNFAGLIVVIVASGIGLATLPDYSEEEMIMYDNLVFKKQWEEIIHRAEIKLPEHQTGKVALSLALAKTGRLTSRIFEFNPSPDVLFMPSYQVKGMAPFIANEPYYYLGLNNFAQMLAMESMESAPDAAMPVRAVKRYAETCIINGQYDVAAKFLRLLQRTIFYRKWATEALSVLSDEAKIEAYDEWAELRRNMVRDDFYYQKDQMNFALFSLLRSAPDNKIAYEYLMTNSLLNKDFDEFLKYIMMYPEMGYTEVPVSFEEALIYIKTLAPDLPDNVAGITVSNDVIQRIQGYGAAFGSGGNKNPQSMKNLYGKTYWYYLHFSQTDDK